MAHNDSPLLIWGTGGHAVSVLETAVASGAPSITFVSAEPGVSTFERHPCIDPTSITNSLRDHLIVVAIGDNSTRQRVVQELLDMDRGVRFATLIHPSAIVSASAAIGAGSVVLQGAILGAKVQVDDHCILNTGSCLDHESVLGNFASLAPRAVTGGRVNIGERSAIGIGTAIRHGITIGSDTVVGSASYVHNDLPGSVVAYGTPARVMRERNGDDPYLS